MYLCSICVKKTEEFVDSRGVGYVKGNRWWMSQGVLRVLGKMTDTKHVRSRCRANENKRLHLTYPQAIYFTGFRSAIALTTRCSHTKYVCLVSRSTLDNYWQHNVPTRNFRSAQRKDLVITRTKLVVASRAFSVAASRNSLPPVVTSVESVPVFRKRLHTHLFNKGLQTPATLLLPHLRLDIIA